MKSQKQISAKLNKAQNYDTLEWNYISSIRVKDSLVQEYKDNGKLEELQNHLIEVISKEVKEKLV